MSVYVDNIRPCLRSRRWPFNHSCHLLADTLTELHDFAKRLGLKREWFQSQGTPHYDLTAGRRVKAIGLGARQIGMRETVEIIRELRKHRA